MSKRTSIKLHQYVVFLAGFITLLLGVFVFRGTSVTKIDESNAAGPSYYIDSQSGNDSASGTSSTSPWRTLSKVKSFTLQPGTTVYLKRGSQWREQLTFSGSGTSNLPIVFDAYGSGALPRIYGLQDGISNWTSNGTNLWSASVPQGNSLLFVNDERWIDKGTASSVDSDKEYAFENGRIHMFYRSNPNTTPSNFKISVLSNLVELRNQQFITIRNLEVVGSGRNGIYVNNLSMPNNGNILFDGVVAQKSFYSGIRIDDASNVTVDNCRSFLNGRAGVWFTMNTSSGSINNTVQNCSTYQNYVYSGIIFHGYGAITEGKENINNKIRNGKILNNVSYQNGDGAYIVYGDNILVENNYFYENDGTGGHYGVSNIGEGYGIGVGRTQNSVFRKNWFKNNETSGIEIWGSEIPVSGSSLTEPYGASNSNTITQNVVQGNDIGVQLGGPHKRDNVISYNLIINNAKFGITQTQDTGAENPNKIFNNTVVNNTLDGIIVPDDRNLDIYNNIVSYNGGRGIRASYNGISSNNVTFSNGGANSQLKSTINLDPQFSNYNGNDFSLKQGSPAINAGLTHILTNDLAGRLISGLPDIGSLEYGSPMVPLTPSKLPIGTSSPMPSASSTPNLTPKVTASPAAVTATPVASTIAPTAIPTTGIFEIPAIQNSASSGIYDTDHIGSLDSWDWVSYENVNLNKGLQELQFLVARPEGNATIYVRTGSQSGKIVAQLNIQPTGSWNNYIYQKATLIEPVSGVQDLYLTFGSYATANLKTLRFNTVNVLATPVATPFATQTVAPTPTLKPPTGYTVEVFASGTALDNVFPTLEVYINDKLQDRRIQTSGILNSYIYQSSTPVSSVEVKFINDASRANPYVDRNAYIEKVIYNSTTLSPTSGTVYSTGTWTSDNGCEGGYKTTGWLDCNGSMFFVFDSKATIIPVKLRARGTVADAGFPVFNLVINDSIVMSRTVSDTSQIFDYVHQAPSIQNLSVHFINDLHLPSEQQDRNIQIDYVSIGSSIIETESPSIFSTGSWRSNDGCNGGYKQSEWLHCNGSIRIR